MYLIFTNYKQIDKAVIKCYQPYKLVFVIRRFLIKLKSYSVQSILYHEKYKIIWAILAVLPPPLFLPHPQFQKSLLDHTSSILALFRINWIKIFTTLSRNKELPVVTPPIKLKINLKQKLASMFANSMLMFQAPSPRTIKSQEKYSTCKTRAKLWFQRVVVHRQASTESNPIKQSSVFGD